MGMRDVSGSEGYMHGNENGFAWEWEWHGREWVCIDESLEREMGIRDVSGSEGYVHGNENGFAWEW